MKIKSKLVLFIICFIHLSPSYATCVGINCTCTVSATSVAFGNYVPTNASNVDTTGNVQVTCSALLAGLNVAYSIALNSGNGNFSQRQMKNGSALLTYNLYTDSARSLIWGDGTSSTNIVSDSYNLSVLSTSRNYTIYGRCPGLQTSVIPGTYNDTITVTVTY